MTKFNPEGKETLTYGESLSPAMEITELEDAKQYFESYVAFLQKYLDKEPDPNGKTAEQIAKINIGYYAGYYSESTRERVERLFNCQHPIFGSVKLNGSPTAEKAVTLGKIAAIDSKNN